MSVLNNVHTDGCKENLRIQVISIIFFLGFIALTARLFYWQVIKSTDLSGLARKQYQSETVVTAPRGNIFARDGSTLVGRSLNWIIYASIPEISISHNKLADALSPLLVNKEEVFTESGRIKGLLNKEGSVWVPLKKRVDETTKKNIEALKFNGLNFESEEIRTYPEASTAAHLLGFVGKNQHGDDVGYFGLEGYYDIILSGKPGLMAKEFDARGIPIAIGEEKEVQAKQGVDLVTSLDKGLQIMVEEKLKLGLEKYGAKAGTVIVMDPVNGEVISMASYPGFEPAKYWTFTDDLFKNPGISDSFEPGSVFKVIIMASALDAGVIDPQVVCETCGGPVKIDKYTIETWDRKYRPDSTMTEVVVHSDNVGMVEVGRKLGSEVLCDYLERFGIGKLTGIDLQGEVSPALRKKGSWNEVDLATASFGQGIAVTPIQMVRAVGAIANKGLVVKPVVVKKLVGEGWAKELEVAPGVRVISEKASAEMAQMMVEAAKSGESKWTYLRGFRVAGKTGTAQIPISGHYDEEKTNASFVGFAPAEKPKFVMLVTLREPQTSPWASETAAPLWYNIAKDLFLYFGIQPEG